jgi:hypothetical protein
MSTRQTNGYEDRDLAQLIADNAKIELRNVLVTIDGTLLLDWVSRNMEPEDIFDEKQIAAWAKYNGYVKAE